MNPYPYMWCCPTKGAGDRLDQRFLDQVLCLGGVGGNHGRNLVDPLRVALAQIFRSEPLCTCSRGRALG